MPEDDAECAARLRRLIVEHLRRYPHAGDTVDGITACWLPPRGFEDAPQHINDVIARMVVARELVSRHLPDGRVLFVRGPALPDTD